MIKQIYLCDRCKQEVAEPVMVVGKKYEGVCFCESCMDKILDEAHTIDEAAVETIKVEEPMPKKTEKAPEERVKRVKREELDVPKIIALRRAGWSLEKIADEMGASAATIFRVLNNHKE